jgi:hypothetical protein
MASVIDFLEKMGSEAQWRNASHDEIELALDKTEIETPMCSAILSKNASEVQALLRQIPLIGFQVPSPTPLPDEEEEQEGDDEDSDEDEPSKDVHYSPAALSLSRI